MKNRQIQNFIKEVLTKIESLADKNDYFFGLCHLSGSLMRIKYKRIDKCKYDSFKILMMKEYLRQTGKPPIPNQYWWKNKDWYEPRIKFLKNWLKHLKDTENE
jgi:hypothetical protein